MNHSLSENLPILMECYVCNSKNHLMSNCSFSAVNRKKVINQSCSYQNIKQVRKRNFKRKIRKKRSVLLENSNHESIIESSSIQEDAISEKSCDSFDAKIVNTLRKINKPQFISMEIQEMKTDNFNFMLHFEKLKLYEFYFPKDNATLLIPRARDRYHSMLINVMVNYKEEKQKSKKKMIELQEKHTPLIQQGEGIFLRSKTLNKNFKTN